MEEYDTVTKISIVPRGVAEGVTIFTPDEEFNRKVTDGFLSQSLKDRIDELDDPWDDDDDGDVPAIVRR